MLIDKFTAFYQDLNRESVKNLNDVYHDDICFDDPVGSHSGLQTVKDYFDGLLTNTLGCRFNISNVIKEDNQAFIVWTMHYEHPKLKGGKTLTVNGTSYIKIQDEKVIYQRDYFDLGEMLYENVPLIGRIILWLKNGLKT
jgi:limonene-1,2-epoxide hydrolase